MLNGVVDMYVIGRLLVVVCEQTAPNVDYT